MSNPFGPQENPGSYMELRKKLFQRVQAAKINEQMIEIIRRSLEAENVVLSRPERKQLFSEIVRLVSNDLTGKLDDETIPV